jgi:hypothetical protein
MTGSEPTTTETPASGEPTPTPNPAPASPDTSNTPAPEDDGEGTVLTPKEGEKTEDNEPKVEQTDEEKAADEARAALYGAPEGDYTLPELPEGQTVDTEMLAAATPIAKELNLSDAGFGKLVEFYTGTALPKVQETVVDNLQKDIAAQHTAWANESMEMVRTDPIFKGQKLSDVQAVAAKALDRFGGSEIREFLQSTGLGNHPALVKAFYGVGTAISEDTTFERGGSAPVTKSSVEKFYGDKG